MTDNELTIAICSAMLGIMVFLLGMKFGCCFGDDKEDFYEEAVKSGAGEYFLDDDNEKQFRFNTPEISQFKITPPSKEVMAIFDKLRFDCATHLGNGEVRLSVKKQNEILDLLSK